MKDQNLIYGVLICFLFACKGTKSQKEYTIFSGTIKNTTAKNLVIKNHYFSDNMKENITLFEKKIPLNADGTFRDTLYLETPFDSTNNTSLLEFSYNLYLDKTLYLSVVLEKGQDLDVVLDFNIPDKREVVFSGTAAPNNEYLREKVSLVPTINSYIAEEKDDMVKNIFNLLLEKHKITETFRKAEIQGNEAFFRKVKKEREETKKLHQKGDISTDFTYENYKGSTTSLSEFKGKYVFIDVWASWCGPCIHQIPHMKKLHEKYHDKNIAFIGISLDHKKQDWKDAVADYELKGVQLIWKGTDDAFLNKYAINSIPRFILLDPTGKIIDPNAPRPSLPKLEQILDNLLQ